MLPLTYPGVYVQELSSGVHTITGVATSIAAFIGWAPQGPTGQAVLVQSWSDYQSQFGGFSAGNYLGYSVSQFFANGGQRAYIVRLVGSGNLTATNQIGGSPTLYAASPGGWGNNLQIAVTPQPGNTARFSLQVIDGTSGKVLESYANLSVAANDPQYVVTVINNDSQYVTFVNPSTQASTAPSAAPFNNTIPGPAQQAPVPHTTGGTLAAGSYFYQVSALYGNVESAPSNEQSATTTGATSSNTISWNAAPSYQGQSPSGYRIYRGTAAGKESGYYAPGNVTTFADTGAATLTTGTPVAVGLSGGVDGTVLKPNDGNFEPAVLAAINTQGLLDRVPIFNLLCVPGEQDAATIQSLQAYCYNKRARSTSSTRRRMSRRAT